MKILLTIKTLTHSVGGAEKMVASLAGALAQGRDDVSVEILTFDKQGAVPFFSVPDNNITLHQLGVHGRARKTRFYHLPPLLWRLRKRVQDIKPDIVVTFMHSSFVPVSVALIGTGVKVVFSEHTAPIYYKSRQIELLLMRLCSLLVRHITIVSEGIRVLYPREMARKMDILPNPVISDFIAADVVGQSVTRKKILSVGRLNRDKDYKVLIEAFSILARKYPDWDLVIVGEGEERASLEQQISLLNLDGRVLLPGVTTDIDAAYKGAQIFVLPSRYESFGLATAEAMSHALPTIGFSDCSGTRELIEHEKTGFLVEERSSMSLANAMEKLIISPALRSEYGENGYERSLKYRSDKVSDIWIQYLRSMIE